MGDVWESDGVVVETWESSTEPGVTFTTVIREGDIVTGGSGGDLSDAAPQDLGTAAAGVSDEASRADHVHDMPTATDVGADPSGTAATAVTVHTADTTAVHGIADTSALVVTSDARLSDARTPTAHTHPAADIASGTVGTARLGSGTADATTFLRGDQTWAAAGGGGGVTEVRITTTSFHSLDGPANNPRPVGISSSQSRGRSILSPFTATGTTQVFGGVPWLPWSTVDIWIDFLNTNASAGDVKWQVAFGGQAGAHTQLTLYAATVAVTAASGNETTYGQRYTQKIASAVAVATTDMLDCQVVRLGDDAADTLAGSVWLKQLRFREAGT